jgi:hypothetical protein
MISGVKVRSEAEAEAGFSCDFSRSVAQKCLTLNFFPVRRALQATFYVDQSKKESMMETIPRVAASMYRFDANVLLFLING